jgi:hypothetical protein
MIRLTGKVREAGKAKGSRKGSRHPGRLRAAGKVQGIREG